MEHSVRNSVVHSRCAELDYVLGPKVSEECLFIFGSYPAAVTILSQGCEYGLARDFPAKAR